jgi:uncharacterized membrane protein YheB (UPF0754 family)
MIFEQKNFFTNFIAGLIIIIGMALKPTFYGELLTTAGLFALSGAVTNWLAIYMLFEKIPFLYGSGVIPMQFKAFKLGIKNLIMIQFFTENNISKFLDTSIANIEEKINYDDVFSSLTDAIMQSSFAGMLSMFGGVAALEPLRDPIKNKFRVIVQDLISKTDFKANSLHFNIEKMVDARLEELTPKMVKDIIQEMIHKHLGWLVVWGGVFGGLIGIAAAFV